MKRLLSLALSLWLLAPVAQADEQTRDVQTALKSEGFFYGEVTGQMSAETTSAIRRYQIRNGLEVTGTLTDETLAALGVGGAPTAEPPPAPAPPPTTPRARSLEESDRDFLRRTEPAPAAPVPAPAPIRPPAPRIPAPSAFDESEEDLADFFAGTPYASAPLEVQESTLRRAQSYLATRGFYHDRIDGVAGPATEEAVLAFQRRMRLPLSGRLDLATLGRMALLPGRAPIAPAPGGFVPQDSEGTRIYRGIWIR